jgi:hypothetical protein
MFSDQPSLHSPIVKTVILVRRVNRLHEEKGVGSLGSKES